MQLAEWISREGITQTDFAGRIGVVPSVVSEICSGKIWPRRRVVHRIEEATNGEVTANDFADLGRAPAQIPSEAAE